MKKLLFGVVAAATITTVVSADVKYEMGIGANYGGIIGATANTKVQPNIELFGGLGLIGAVAGVRYYINDNVRLNANYGTHGLIVPEEEQDGDTEFLYGINVGVDYLWKNGVSLGFVYRATSNADDVIDEWKSKGYTVEDKSLFGDFGLSFGYRF